jgi:hypothetical protein
MVHVGQDQHLARRLFVQGLYGSCIMPGDCEPIAFGRASTGHSPDPGESDGEGGVLGREVTKKVQKKETLLR